MAGGIGSRFWPLCTPSNPKQFLDLLGSGLSMLQSTFQRFTHVCPRENIIIVTSQGMEAEVRHQLPGLLGYQVLEEPLRRNTAPCVAYAAAIISRLNPNANIIVSPSDHAIFGDTAFEKNISNAVSLADSHDWILTLGAQPVNPNTKYGYIQFAAPAATTATPDVHKVITFTEKPPVDMAVQFISSGEFLWNAGIFVWRLPVLRAAFETYLPSIASKFFDINFDTPRPLLDRIYASTEAISLDFGIMEKASNVYVMQAAFGWSDVETWDSLYNTAPKDEHGNVVVSGDALVYDTTNCVVHLPAHKRAVVQGLDNFIVTDSGDTLLICPRNNEEMLIKFSSDLELKFGSGR